MGTPFLSNPAYSCILSALFPLHLPFVFFNYNLHFLFASILSHLCFIFSWHCFWSLLRAIVSLFGSFLNVVLSIFIWLSLDLFSEVTRELIWCLCLVVCFLMVCFSSVHFSEVLAAVRNLCFIHHQIIWLRMWHKPG